METPRNLHADICRIQNYLDTKIRAPMDIEEQKALCNLVLNLIACDNNLGDELCNMVLHILAKDSDSN